MIKSLQNIEDAFLNALNGDSNHLEELILSPNANSRFKIYQTSIIATHQSALYKIFKPLEALLGLDAFHELCYRYVINNLSTHFNFNHYGDKLHIFAKSAPYAKNIPYLSDFIEFCYLWHQIFLNPDQPPIKIESAYPLYKIWEICQIEYIGDKTIDNWSGPFCYTMYRKNGKVIVLEEQ